jgi:hypothetical protein
MSPQRRGGAPAQHQDTTDQTQDAGGAGASVIPVPGGVTPREARFVLRMFTRLKEKRFGRLTLTLSDARLVDVELVERVDREILRLLQPRHFPG